jgi:transposase
MPLSKKTSYSNEFKSKVALEAIKNDKTVADLVVEYNVASSLISKWKKQLLDNVATAFSVNTKPQSIDNKEKQLYEQIGKLSMEVNYLKKFVNGCR